MAPDHLVVHIWKGNAILIVTGKGNKQREVGWGLQAFTSRSARQGKSVLDNF